MALARSISVLTFVKSLSAALALVLLAALPCAAAAGTLKGRVLDPQGRAVAGARIIISGPLAVVASAVTDAGGAFTVHGLPASRYDVHVEAAGFRAEPLPVMMALDETKDIEIALTVSALTESIVVSAAQTEVPRSKAPASLAVFTREDLDVRQIQGVADALRLVPGMVVNRSGGRGAIVSVFPRGGESDYTLVLVDGIRLNAMGGGFDFAHLPVADVERLEIVRGPQSAVFGADAIGGVVSVITRRGGPTRASITAEGGSLHTLRTDATAAGTLDVWKWGTTIEREASDGFRGRAPGTSELVSNDDYRRHTFSASGGWQPRAASELRASLRVARHERGFPGAFGSDPGGTYGGVDRISRGSTKTRAFSLNGAHPLGERVHLRAQVTRTDLDGEFASPFASPSDPVCEFLSTARCSRSTTDRWSARVQSDVAVTGHLNLSSGIEWLDEQAASSFILDASGLELPIARNNAGAFAEARFEPSARLLLAAGVRVERIHREPLAADGFGGRPRFDADTRTSLNPRIAASAWLVPADSAKPTWTRLHGSAGTGIRAPDAFEIAFTNNPSLAPERSRSFDIGIEQALRGGRVIVDATAFSNRYDDLIVAVGRTQQDASRYRTDNIANARARGLELSVASQTRGRFGSLDARLAYTWLDTEILAVDGRSGEAPVPFTPGDALIRRPRHSASLDVTISQTRWSAFFNLRGRGAALDIDPTFGAFGGTFEATGYAVAHAGARVRVMDRLHVFARIDNLFDRTYEEALGFPALGRTFSAGVTLAASR